MKSLVDLESRMMIEPIFTSLLDHVHDLVVFGCSVRRTIR